MTFEEAEGKFRELQSRVQRGEPISRAEYEDQVSRLAVQDQFGVLWEINPRTGKWMYFDGAEWVSGAPPGKETSTVIPLSSLPGAPTTAPTSAKTASTVSPSPMPRQTAPMATRSAPVAPPAPPRTAAPSAQPEGPRPYTRAVKQTRPAAPPPPPGDGKAAPRTAGNLLRPGLEWVPLAIAAVALLICAVLLWFGGSWALATFGTKTSTPTRIAATQIPSVVVPTVVRLPSPTPIPPTPAPVVIKVVEATANVRATPSTKAARVSTVKKDQQFTVIGRANDGQFDWYQINITGAAQPGWVRSDIVQVVSGDPKTIPLPGAATPTRGAGAQTTPTVIGVFPATPKP